MAHSQTSGRVRSTRRARRPDGGVYRMLRMKRRPGRGGRIAGLVAAMAIVVALAAVVWVLFWR